MNLPRSLLLASYGCQRWQGVILSIDPYLYEHWKGFTTPTDVMSSLAGFHSAHSAHSMLWTLLCTATLRRSAGGGASGHLGWPRPPRQPNWREGQACPVSSFPEATPHDDYLVSTMRQVLFMHKENQRVSTVEEQFAPSLPPACLFNQPRNFAVQYNVFRWSVFFVSILNDCRFSDL